MTMLATPSLPGGAPPAWADAGLGNITQHFFGVPQLGAGTMYADHASCGPVAGCRAGMAGACNESPIMASLALQHMLLQSWNGRPIAIFPSVPASWEDARFARMRAEGAVLVSGLRANSSTVWFSLNATRGGGSLAVHSTITDLACQSDVRRAIASGIWTALSKDSIAIILCGQASKLTLTAGKVPGLFEVAVAESAAGASWTALCYSKAKGRPPPSALQLSPLPPGQENLWGSRARAPPPPAPPAPAPSPPPALPPCPPSGCAGCGGCHWPYENGAAQPPTSPSVLCL